MESIPMRWIQEIRGLIMPKQLVLSRVPVDLSIVEYDLTSDEDLFLSYTWELENGPPIIRDGEGPPFMQVIGGLPNQTTTDPLGLRLGTWLICDDMRSGELGAAQELLQAATAAGSDADVLDVLQR